LTGARNARPRSLFAAAFFVLSTYQSSRPIGDRLGFRKPGHDRYWRPGHEPIAHWEHLTQKAAHTMRAIKSLLF
jgi:hypothetical protein